MPYRAITRDSRHPFETYVLTACVIAGGSAVFGNLWPGAITAAFPSWAQNIWGCVFGGGALTALVGIWYKRRPLGVFLEQIGLAATGGMCFTYAASLAVYNIRSGFSALCLFALVGAACVRQWYRLHKFLKRVNILATEIEEGKK